MLEPLESRSRTRRASDGAITQNASGPSDGIIRLVELGRLDLSVEAIALRPEVNSLFASAELASAKHRLREAGYESWRRP